MAGCFGLVTAAAIALAVSTVLIKKQQLLTEAARQQADQKSIEAKQAQEEALVETRRAVAAEAKAKAEAERARKSDADAQELLYFSNIALAQQFLHEGEIREAFKTLDNCPEQCRGWEWTFLRDVARRNRKSFYADVKAMWIAFSPNGRQIAIVTSQGELLLRDEPAERFVLRKKVHDGEVRGVAWRSDGQALATTGSDGLARVWSVPSGELLTELRGHEKPLTRALAFSQDGKLLATGGEDLTVQVWDPQSGKSLHKLNCESEPNALAWQGNGPGLLIAEEKARVTHWDTATQQQYEIPLSRGHSMCAYAPMASWWPRLPTENCRYCVSTRRSLTSCSTGRWGIIRTGWRWMPKEARWWPTRSPWDCACSTWPAARNFVTSAGHRGPWRCRRMGNASSTSGPVGSRSFPRD